MPKPFRINSTSLSAVWGVMFRKMREYLYKDPNLSVAFSSLIKCLFLLIKEVAVQRIAVI